MAGRGAGANNCAQPLRDWRRASMSAQVRIDSTTHTECGHP